MALSLAGAALASAGALWRFAPAWSVFLLLLGFAFAIAVLRDLWAFLLFLTAAAALVALGFFGSLPPDSQGLAFGAPQRYSGRVVEDPGLGERGYRMLVDLDGVADAAPSSPWRQAAGLVTLGTDLSDDFHPGLGDRVIFRGALHPPGGFRNPGNLWQEMYVTRRGIAARSFAFAQSTLIVAQPDSESSVFYGWRRKLSEAITDASPGPGGAALRSITLGDRTAIDPATFELFRRTGTVHLLSVSGLHLSIVLLIFMALFKALFCRIAPLALRHPVEPLARLAALFPVTAYALVCGLSVPTLRSLLMAAMVVLLAVLSRRTSTFAILSSTLFVLLLLNPLSVTDPGLQLSFAAIVGLFWLAPRFNLKDAPTDPLAAPKTAWQRFGTALGRGIRATIGASIAATLLTAPLAAFHFGQGGWSGILYNCLAVPLSGFVTLPLSLAGALLYHLIPAVAAYFWKAAGLSMDLLLRAMSLWDFKGAPDAFAPFATIWSLLGAYVCLAALLLRDLSVKPRAGLALLGVALALGPGAATAAWQRLDPSSHLYLLDVEDGLSAALRLPGGKWMLVDGGGLPGSSFDVGREVVWPALKALGCDRLTVVVSTHPHPDHLLGLEAAVRLGRPEELWLPRSFHEDPRYGQLLKAAFEAGARVLEIGGENLDRDFGGVKVRAFNAAGRGENDRGLRVELQTGATKVLLPGDVEAAEQERLLLIGAIKGPATVLVASHHGLPDAVSRRFIGELRPKLTLVSCGDRRRLPSPELLSALKETGSEVAVTKDSGAVHVSFDGGGFSFGSAVR